MPQANALDRLEETLIGGDGATARYVLSELQQDLLARCAQDGLFWLRFVRTRDEADTEPVKPFPIHKAYVTELWREIDRHQRVVIAKSRQMMVSWLLCAYAGWTARFHPHKTIIWQTQKAEDAIKMVSMPAPTGFGGYFGRCQFIERHVPSWMRIAGLQEREGALIYPNGSLIEALAGGANQVRGKTPSLIIEDEFAFQPEAAGVYQAMAPLIQKATKFIAVSTPNGPTGMFPELFHGAAMQPAA